jgi:hypothetical protein
MWRQTYFARIVSQIHVGEVRKIRDPYLPKNRRLSIAEFVSFGVLNLPERQA